MALIDDQSPLENHHINGEGWRWPGRWWAHFDSRLPSTDP